MFVPQQLQTPANTLLSSTLLVASHSSLSPDSWWCFWCFPNVSELPSDVIIFKCLFSLCFPVLTQTYHTFLLCGCMPVVIRWFCIFVFVFLLVFFACNNMHFARSCYGPQSHFRYFIPAENPQTWTNKGKRTNITLTTLGIYFCFFFFLGKVGLDLFVLTIGTGPPSFCFQLSFSEMLRTCMDFVCQSNAQNLKLMIFLWWSNS